MSRKYLLVVIAVIAIIITAVAFAAFNNKSEFSTDNVKKYVEKMKQKETYPDEKTKKAMKSIFPKMKLE